MRSWTFPDYIDYSNSQFIWTACQQRHGVWVLYSASYRFYAVPQHPLGEHAVVNRFIVFHSGLGLPAPWCHSEEFSQLLRGLVYAVIGVRRLSHFGPLVPFRRVLSASEGPCLCRNWRATIEPFIGQNNQAIPDHIKCQSTTVQAPKALVAFLHGCKMPLQERPCVSARCRVPLSSIVPALLPEFRRSLPALRPVLLFYFGNLFLCPFHSNLESGLFFRTSGIGGLPSL